jgi:hypothetical protein
VVDHGDREDQDMEAEAAAEEDHHIPEDNEEVYVEDGTQEDHADEASISKGIGSEVQLSSEIVRCLAESHFYRQPDAVLERLSIICGLRIVRADSISIIIPLEEDSQEHHIPKQILLGF